VVTTYTYMIYLNNVVNMNGGRVEDVFDDSKKRANIKLFVGSMNMGITSLSLDLVVGHAQLTVTCLLCGTCENPFAGHDIV
jgi:hypothetical protein